jgi:hypothetical protein
MASDSFTYANGALPTVSGGLWTTPAGAFQAMQVSGNTVIQGVTSAVDAAAIFNTATGSNNNWAEATISSFSGAANYVNIGVCCRSDAGGQNLYFAVRTSNNIIELYKTVGGSAGVGGPLANSALANTAAAGVLRIDANGSTIRVLWNGTQVISVTDTSVPTGQYTGLASYWEVIGNTSTISLDNWQNSGALSITPANTVHGHTTTAPTLIPDVAAGSTVHAHIADSPTLIVGAFVADSTVHAHIASSPTLTAIPPPATLVPADNVHAQTATTVTFPVTVPTPRTVSGRKLLDQTGQPILLNSWSSWCMAQNGTNADITTALTSLAARGINCITLSPCGSNYNSYGGTGWVRYQNQAGQAFFTGATFSSSLGPAWASVDHVISECNRLGMFVLFSIYTGWNNEQGIGVDLVAAGTAAARTYGRNIADRYATATNLMWHYGADFSFEYGDVPSQVVDQCFRGIRDGEAAAGITPRLICCEPMQPRTSYNQFISQQGTSPAGYEWLRLSINSLYDYRFNTVENWDTVYAEQPLPVWDCEIPYRGANWTTTPTTQELRERIYSTYIRGACGVGYGDGDYWQFGLSALGNGGASGWSNALTRPETVQYGYACALIDRYVNDTAWAPSGFVAAGSLGSGDTKAAGGSSAMSAVAYFPTSRTVTVNTTLVTAGAQVRVRWYDPTADSYTLISAGETKTASRTVAYPSGTHGDGFADWLLVVDAVITLTVDSTVHGHTADTPTPTAIPPAITLVVASTVHGHTADTISFVLAGVLLLRLGAVIPDGLRVGVAPVAAIYHGTTKVWG